MKHKHTLYLGFAVLFAASSADARFFRIGSTPNGSASRCQTCHISPAGRDARNAFGLDVEARVTPNGREEFWGPELAAIDSDGDGFTNGEELGDPEGVWVSGESPAGHSALASNPGFDTSTPPPADKVAVLNLQLDAAASGQEVQVSRAIAGRASDYAWTDEVGEDGTASVVINAVGDSQFRRIGANGYYRARTVDESGNVVSKWRAFPVRGGNALDVTLNEGGWASVSPLAGTALAVSSKPALGTAFDGPTDPASPGFGSTLSDRSIAVTVDDPAGVTGGDFTVGLRGDAMLAGVSVNGSSVAVEPLDDRAFGFTVNGPVRSVEVTLASGERADAVLRGLLLDANGLPFAELTVRPEAGVTVAFEDRLHQNFPNPFNPATQVRYDLGSDADVRLTVHNAIGQEVARLVESRQAAGTHSVTWDAAGFASGTYYLRLTTGDRSLVRKMTLAK